MSQIFEAKTKTGQKVIYCIAGGHRGRQAIRELQRVCKSDDIVKVSPQETDSMGSSPDEVRSAKKP
ncbi:MAG: hypothetical protein H6875_00565 [Hyphomicrobiaceae bacterium]|mgnify:FL=1|nr:hypothetical protein [Hyphomicrobiaceae bacterium]